MSHASPVTPGSGDVLVDALADYTDIVLNDADVPDDFRAAVRRSTVHTEPLDDFIRVAHHRPHWRSLYIDASILKVLACADAPGLDEDGVRDCIAILDRAIVIAGAGLDAARRDYVLHDIVRHLQSAIPRRPSSGAVLIAQSSPVAQLSTARNGMRTLAALPSLLAPHHTWSRSPFLLPRYAHEWPAIHRWPSLSYLLSVAGPGRIVPVEVGRDYRSADWSQKLISWEDFLTSLDASPQHPIYLAQHSLFAQFPDLRDDFFLPDIVYASLDSPSVPAYRPPRDVIVNAWLGPKGTISPAHTDPFFNCYVQVVGRKTVWLAPPDVASAMYPYQPSLAGADTSRNPEANTTSPLMDNTSQVDVFCVETHEPAPSQSAFPLFWDTVPGQASCVTLLPGDLLFFPPGWWHAMRSEDVSFSVSMWF